MNRKEILQTMMKKYVADFDAELMNLNILIDNPQSIPEHSDFITEVDKLISKMSELVDKAEVVSNLLPLAARTIKTPLKD